MTDKDGGSSSHPPRSDVGSGAVLDSGALVRDVATGATSSAQAWMDARAKAEGRDNDEVSDELMNAIARGDLVVVGDDDRTRGRAELSDDVESGGP